MNKREAKKYVLGCAAALLDPAAGHLNGFVYEDNDGNDRPPKEIALIESALQELVDELYRRGNRS